MSGPFSPVEVRTDIPTPPEAVWAVISDPETYPAWLVGAQRIRGVDPEFPRPGSEFAHSVGPTGGTTVDDRTEVADVDAPHRLDLVVHAGPFTADVELLVLPAPDGSEVRLREQPTGVWAVLGPLLRPILHVRNAESLRRLRLQLLRTARPSPPPSGAASRRPIVEAT